MNGRRPVVHGSNLKAVEPGVAVMAFVDHDSHNRLTLVLVREASELAVAAIFAIAIGKLASLELPHRHDRTPMLLAT